MTQVYPDTIPVSHPGNVLCPTCAGKGRHKYLLGLRECEQCWGVGEVDSKTLTRLPAEDIAPKLRDALNALAFKADCLQKRLDRLADQEAELNLAQLADQVYPTQFKHRKGGYGD